jgi:hypothetical protein
MNIIHIFVEIIKKSTTMKNLFLSLVLVLTNLVVNSQVISVHVTGFQLYTRPKTETLSESQTKNTLNYVSFNTLDADYVFDLTNNVFTQIDNVDNSVWSGIITEVRTNNNIIDVSVGDAIFKLVPKNNTQSDVFIIEYNNSLDSTNGFFSMLNDFSFEYK